MTRPGGNLFPPNMGSQPNSPYQQFPNLSRSPYAGGPQSGQLSQRSSIQGQMMSTPFAKPSPMGPMHSHPMGPMGPQSMSPPMNMFGSQPGPYGGMQKSPFQPQLTPFQNPMQQNKQFMQSQANGNRQSPFFNPMNMRQPNMMPPNMMNPNMMNQKMMPGMMHPGMMNPNMMNPNMMGPNLMQQNMMMANMMRHQMAVNAHQQRMIHKMREEQRKQQEQEDQEENDALDRMIGQLEKQQDALQDIATSVREDFEDVRNNRRAHLERKYLKQQLTRSVLDGRDLSANQRSTTYEDDSYGTKRNRNSSHDTARARSNRDWLYSQESSRADSRESDRDYGRGGSSQQRSNYQGEDDYQLKSPYLGRTMNSSRYTPRDLYSSRNYYDATEEIHEEESAEGSPKAEERHYEEVEPSMHDDNVEEENDQEEQQAQENHYEEEPQGQTFIRPQFDTARSHGGLFEFKRRNEYMSPRSPLINLNRIPYHNEPQENISAMSQSRSSNFDRTQQLQSARDMFRKKPTIVPNVRGNLSKETQSATIPRRNQEEVYQPAYNETEEAEEAQDHNENENPEVENEAATRDWNQEQQPDENGNNDALQQQEDFAEPKVEEEEQQVEEAETKEPEEEEKPTLFNIKSRKPKKKGKKKKKKAAKAEQPTEEEQHQPQKQQVARHQPQEERPAAPKIKPKIIIPQDAQLMNMWDVPSIKKEPDPSLREKLPPLSKIIPLSTLGTSRSKDISPENKEEGKETAQVQQKLQTKDNEPKRADTKRDLPKIIIETPKWEEPKRELPGEESRREDLQKEETPREQSWREEPKNDSPKHEETNQEETVYKEEPSQEISRLDNSLQPTASISKIRSIPLEKKSYANIPSIIIPQARRTDNKLGSQISISNIDNPNAQTTIVRKNVRLGTIEQKRGLFMYSKK